MKKVMFSLLMFLAFAPFSYAEGDIVVRDAWVREVPPGASVSAAYMTIENKGSQVDKLTALSSDAAENVEIHMSNVDENGIAKMERIKTLELPAGESLELKPGGMHVMLIGLKESLIGIESVTMNLSFEKAGDMLIKVPVKSMKSSGEVHHH